MHMHARTRTHTLSPVRHVEQCCVRFVLHGRSRSNIDYKIADIVSPVAMYFRDPSSMVTSKPQNIIYFDVFIVDHISLRNKVSVLRSTCRQSFLNWNNIYSNSNHIVAVSAQAYIDCSDQIIYNAPGVCLSSKV